MSLQAKILQSGLMLAFESTSAFLRTVVQQRSPGFRWAWTVQPNPFWKSKLEESAPENPVQHMENWLQSETQEHISHRHIQCGDLYLQEDAESKGRGLDATKPLPGLCMCTGSKMNPGSDVFDLAHCAEFSLHCN